MGYGASRGELATRKSLLMQISHPDGLATGHGGVAAWQSVTEVWLAYGLDLGLGNQFSAFMHNLRREEPKLTGFNLISEYDGPNSK